jgi:hypothetical protein
MIRTILTNRMGNQKPRSRMALKDRKLMIRTTSRDPHAAPSWKFLSIKTVDSLLVTHEDHEDQEDHADH